MKKQTRDFKGIWIPKEIWLSEELTLQEKVFLVEIDSLDNKDGCYANNQYFAEFFGISKTRVSLVISSLIDKGFINSEINQSKGNKRTLKTLFNKTIRPSQTKVKDPHKQKLKDNNIDINLLNNKPKEPQSDKPDYLTLFNSFWENYPKKIGKKECKAKYIDMIKKNDIYLHVMIIDALQDQINWRKRADSESAFVPAWKDPIRWLRHECWNDELGEIEHKNKDFKKRTEFNNIALFPQSYKNGKVCVICDNTQLVNGVKCPCVNYDYVPLEHWDEWMKYYKEVKPISYNEYLKGA